MTEVEVSILEKLVEALDVSKKRIKWNGDLDKYVILGKKGEIRTSEKGSLNWSVVVDGMSRRYFSSVKNKLSFMKQGLEFETKDPDNGNKPIKTCLFSLDRLPTEAEANIIRKVLQLPRKKVYSEEGLAKLRENLVKARETRDRAIPF
jgi:hypothetical protein